MCPQSKNPIQKFFILYHIYPIPGQKSNLIVSFATSTSFIAYRLY